MRKAEIDAKLRKAEIDAEVRLAEIKERVVTTGTDDSGGGSEAICKDLQHKRGRVDATPILPGPAALPHAPATFCPPLPRPHDSTYPPAPVFSPTLGHPQGFQAYPPYVPGYPPPVDGPSNAPPGHPVSYFAYPPPPAYGTS